MNPNQISSVFAAIMAAGASVAGFSTAIAQGMPPEARQNIHLLFNRHEAVTRTVTMTKEGYISLTESADPKVAAALKEHVRQMEERLKGGLMVRRHDPAFAEFAKHYEDISHTVEPTEKGMKVTVTGKTPAAIKVAQNHANVVTDFATNGWEAHDRDHATVLGAQGAAAPAPRELSTPSEKSPPACCASGGECQMNGPARKAPADTKSSEVQKHH